MTAKERQIAEMERFTDTVKHRRPKRSEQLSAQTDPGDNTRYISHSLRLAELKRPDMDNVEEVKARILQYLQICAEDDVRPSVAGLSLAMEVDRRRLWEIREGKMGKNPEVAALLKKAMQILELHINNYMQDGKINPVSGIFLMKNNFGYADKQEVIVTPNAPLGEQKDQAVLEAKYRDSVAEEE